MLRYSNFSCLTLFIRLLEAAVKFKVALPFVNPARAELSTVQLEGKKYVIRGGGDNKKQSQNAVFLTTGLVTESALVHSVSSYVPRSGPAGAPVKRIRVRPFSVEYERSAAFFGHFLDINHSKTFAGPIYGNGLGFSTRKESAQKGLFFYSPLLSSVFRYANGLLLAVPSAGSDRFLAPAPTRVAGSSSRASASRTRVISSTYPDHLRVEDVGMDLVVALGRPGADRHFQFRYMTFRSRSILTSLLLSSKTLPACLVSRSGYRAESAQGPS